MTKLLDRHFLPKKTAAIPSELPATNSGHQDFYAKNALPGRSPGQSLLCTQSRLLQPLWGSMIPIESLGLGHYQRSQQPVSLTQKLRRPCPSPSDSLALSPFGSALVDLRLQGKVIASLNTLSYFLNLIFQFYINKTFLYLINIIITIYLNKILIYR